VLAKPAFDAPALIIVGVLMAKPLKDIDWANLKDAIPAFLTATTMAFFYSISHGIAIGFIFYCVIRVFGGKDKDSKIHPVLAAVTILFIADFVISAVL